MDEDKTANEKKYIWHIVADIGRSASVAFMRRGPLGRVLREDPGEPVDIYNHAGALPVGRFPSFA